MWNWYEQVECQENAVADLGESAGVRYCREVRVRCELAAVRCRIRTERQQLEQNLQAMRT